MCPQDFTRLPFGSSSQVCSTLYTFSCISQVAGSAVAAMNISAFFCLGNDRLILYYLVLLGFLEFYITGLR